MRVDLEELTLENFEVVGQIIRDDIPEEFVGDIEELLENMEFGIENHMKGNAFLITADEAYVGYLMIGEAIPWPTDPPELKGKEFYRLMFFVMDRDFRKSGIGGEALEMAIQSIYDQFGKKPIVLGCHKDNKKAERFYVRHGFRKTEYMENDDYYMIRD